MATQIALVVSVSIITALVTTRIIAIKYMNVIDGYAKDLLNEIEKSVSDATGNK